MPSNVWTSAKHGLDKARNSSSPTPLAPRHSFPRGYRKAKPFYPSLNAYDIHRIDTLQLEVFCGNLLGNQLKIFWSIFVRLVWLKVQICEWGEKSQGKMTHGSIFRGFEEADRVFSDSFGLPLLDTSRLAFSFSSTSSFVFPGHGKVVS